MLKIRALKIEVNTTSGLFGAEYKFSNGLNIIRGDNSTGKSSLFQTIIYGLGFEELLGGKNEKTMQSALKDQVEFPRNKLHNITQSFVYLEIENKEIITIKRSVASSSRKSQLIDVFYGAMLTGENLALESHQMYVHDAGGASDELYGFHLFLTEFLELNLPEVVTAKGDLHKLYLQQIAPAFIIEQKTGWSDFLATMPYFGMRNTEQRVVEFLLKLDVFENEKRKQQINSLKQNLSIRWQNLFYKFQNLAERTSGKLVGIENNPSIINSYGGIYISLIRDDKAITLADLNEIQKTDLSALEAQQIATVGKNVNKNEEALNKLNDDLNQVSLNFELLSPELNFDKEKLKQYEKQIVAVEEDLRKNKGALKVNKLGGDLPTETAKNICPTCEQDIKDSLLPSDIKQTPMRIEDNISYLDSQERMIRVYIEGQQKIIYEKETKLKEYQTIATELRQQIRDLKKELVQDERLPSVIEIEKRIDLKRKVEFFNKVLESFYTLIEDLRNLSSEYEKILNKESNLPKDFFSELDRQKLATLKDNFIQLLRLFNYQSKPFDAIRISPETYLPVAQKTDAEQFYNIKFDSSASDFIRCIWAYTTALLKTSIIYNTNHPRLLVFDEPKQQDMSKDSFRSFLTELSKFSNQQVILFASFENSDLSFAEATQGLPFSINKIDDLLIRPIPTNDK
ncbi:MAG: AAA family ATPase [Bacteroidetes bacterium]|nr:AAA family ATPase [Bacteroidota bacterium]